MLDVLTNIMLILISILFIIMLIGMIVFGILFFIIAGKDFIEEIKEKRK